MYNEVQNALIGTNCVLPILAVASVVLRFVARKRKSVPIGIDDWLVVLGAVRSHFYCLNSSDRVCARSLSYLTRSTSSSEQ